MSESKHPLSKTPAKPADSPVATAETTPSAVPSEIGGPQGPEPTRFGDWEKAGRCTDF